MFDDTLKQALSVALNQSPFLNVLSENKVAATLQMMSRPAGTKLTPEVTRELCQRAGSKAYFAGSIASLGTQFVLGLKAVNCQSGDPLAEEQVTATSKENTVESGIRYRPTMLPSRMPGPDSVAAKVAWLWLVMPDRVLASSDWIVV